MHGSETKTDTYQNLISLHDSLKSPAYYQLAKLYMDSTGDKNLFYAEKSLYYAMLSNNNYYIVNGLNLMALVYMNKSDWNNSIKYLNQALGKSDNIKDLDLMHDIANNLGIVYKYSQEFELSLKFHKQALNYAITGKNSRNIVYSLNNIGNLFVIQQNYDSGLQYYLAAEKECSENLNKRTITGVYNNIGYVYFMLKKYEEATQYWNKALDQLDATKDYHTITVLLNNLAEVETITGNYANAERNIVLADSLHNTNNFRDSRKNLYFTAFQLYNQTAKYEKAIDYLNRYIILKDSIYSDDLNNTISKMTSEFKFVKLKNESLIKDQEISNKNKTNKTLLVVILSIIVILVLLFTNIIKSKRLNIKLNNLNNILKVKSDEIKSNMLYAKYIQSSLSTTYLDRNNCVIFDKPKHGVGGDFPLVRQYFDSQLYIAGDCTGHGTSGALLSVFAISKIDQIIKENITINQIVKLLNNSFFSHITRSDNLKGESLCISMLQILNCSESEQKTTFKYCGSKHKIWHHNHLSNELIEYKTDSNVIGEQENQCFKLYTFDAIKGDIVFLASDGFPDQFGENNRGKFKYSKFREMLHNWAQYKLIDTDYPENVLKEWAGESEQTDDILVIAIKI